MQQTSERRFLKGKRSNLMSTAADGLGADYVNKRDNLGCVGLEALATISLRLDVIT